jgi:hypothetical protein
MFSKEIGAKRKKKMREKVKNRLNLMTRSCDFDLSANLLQESTLLSLIHKVNEKGTHHI